MERKTGVAAVVTTVMALVRLGMDKSPEWGDDDDDRVELEKCLLEIRIGWGRSLTSLSRKYMRCDVHYFGISPICC